jgi:hypothetical protein
LKTAAPTAVWFCQTQHGNARSFVCPYHQRTYKLNGDLAGLPFKDGVKDGDTINGAIYHRPYYTRHVISPARVLSHDDGVVRTETQYAVFKTRPGGVSEVYNVGRYIDELIKNGDSLKFRSRLCVYDSEMVLNSLIYPIYPI